MHALIDELVASARRHGPGTVAPVLGGTLFRNGWVSAGDAAALAGLSVRQVERLARGGQLVAMRPGREWLIDRQAAEDYGRRRRVA